MRNSILAALAALSMLFVLLSGCGSETPASSVISAPQETPEAFGTEVSVTEAENATVSPTVQDASPEIPAPDSAVFSDADTGDAPSVVPVDLGENVVFAIAYCSIRDQLSYDAEDPIFFWRSVGYLAASTAGDFGFPTEDGFARITREDVLRYANALFADFSGDIPFVTEEDPLVSMGSGGDYLINTLSTDDLSLSISFDDNLTSCNATSGSYSMAFALTSYTGSAEDSSWFPFSVAEVTAP